MNVLLEHTQPHPNYKSFPYSFQSIIPGEDNYREEIVINNKEDVIEYAIRLDREARELSNDGPESLLAVFEQLPFFCCYSSIYDEQCQQDIEKYLYCNETSTPAYPGSYNETPSIWIKKYYTIKKALALKQKRLREKASEASNGSK